MKKRNRKIWISCIAIITAMSLIGCTDTGSVSSTVEPTGSTEIASSEQSVDDTNIGGNPVEVGSNVAETSEIESTEEKNSVVETTEEETTIGETLLIEQKIDDLYNEYKEFYLSVCITKDELRNCYYILNNKLFDENGKRLISNNEIEATYTDIITLLFPFTYKTKIDYLTGNYDYDIDLSFGTPSILSLIEQNDDESKYIVKKIQEYESFRNDFEEKMNQGKIDMDLVFDYSSSIENNTINSEKELGDNLTYQFVSDYIDSVPFYILMATSHDMDYFHKYRKYDKKMGDTANQAVEQTKEKLNAKAR